MARRPIPTHSPPGPWRWAAGGALAGALLAAVLSLPASWLASGVAAATRGQVLLQNTRGTVWNGSAQLVLTGGAGSQDAAALPSRLEWNLRPAWSGVRAQVQSACCIAKPLDLAWAWRWRGGRLQVTDGRSQWPAALLSGLGTPWNTLQLQGDLDVQTRGLVLTWTDGRLAVEGQAELTAARVASRISTLRPLGSYRLLLAGGVAPTLQLSTLEGALQLSGTGQWVGSRLQFRGEASAAPNREAALSNLLNIIGRRAGPRSLITIG